MSELRSDDDTIWRPVVLWGEQAHGNAAGITFSHIAVVSQKAVVNVSRVLAHLQQDYSACLSAADGWNRQRSSEEHHPCSRCLARAERAPGGRAQHNESGRGSGEGLKRKKKAEDGLLSASNAEMLRDGASSQ
ncbi:hypothetical protein NDU88_001661 [Pleurodeles waltl]|uniref:Uncharacterized protein n=1 Tax=Pleurodeles waltl TaxID=8319 RepID=A0AAV7WL79_PLEWA|nr:hypothetical protein NDU88_001661 [Pleurodeles waltl]